MKPLWCIAIAVHPTAPATVYVCASRPASSAAVRPEKSGRSRSASASSAGPRVTAYVYYWRAPGVQQTAGRRARSPTRLDRGFLSACELA